MSTPTYVVKKVGDRYVTVPTGSQCAMTGIAGGLLALVGLKRGGFFGTLSTLTGGALLYRGITGRSPWDALRQSSASAPDGDPNSAPSYPHGQGARSGQHPADELDEASMESFPASDPPAHTRTT